MDDRAVFIAGHVYDSSATADQANSASQRLTMPERVAQYLRSNHPHAYCDDCIANALHIHRAQVSLITATLGLCREFFRGSKACVVCSSPNKFATHYYQG